MLAEFTGPSIPDDEILRTSAPLSIWYAARKQATRSPMIKYRAGCVLFNPSNYDIISKGCSHPDVRFSKVLASRHAESHAISELYRRNYDGLWAVVFTYNGRGGCAWSSRPCLSCATALYNSNIDRVLFPERDTEGNWSIIGEHPEALIARAPKPTGGYARQQKIPVL